MELRRNFRGFTNPVRGKMPLQVASAGHAFQAGRTSNGAHDGLINFESNVRVMSWADSKDRARKILNLQKIRGRKNRRLTFDFFSRIFENNKRVKLSLGELKNFLINKFEY